ncbi:alpha/beta fold hydrolase [Caulobacter sp. UNC358MFTsu5.1]|uniref:alpha/beta fold hydrolase n=1 Tax=Caulobacter sp. UNC358MFTsu5.1 TaxID=1449049 RepID=UPI0004A71A2A|nr:alpha/beta hydrolase [Caulobacter sp. UNC358MFTsu5.1]
MPNTIPTARGLVQIMVIVLSLGAVCGSARAADPRDVFRSVDQVRSVDAVQSDGFVEIGGIKQWVSVRGRHADAPLLLFIHGGPGFTSIPSSYYYMRDWREYFTVVQWDQRGAGKTFAANDPKALGPTMTVARMVDDAEEMVAYLRKTYGPRKIILVGHSWGSIVGVKLAQRRPDWFYAYVGTGQFVAFQPNESRGYEATLAAARRDGNAQAVADLERIAPFPDRVDPKRNIENLGVERRWLAHYGGYYWRNNVGHEGQINPLGPDYDDEELRLRDVAQGFSIQALWGELGTVDLRDAPTFSLPVVFIQGRHDIGTNAGLLDEWFTTLRAPKKTLVWFEDSAHMAYQEEPGRFLVTLVDEVLPLTKTP